MAGLSLVVYCVRLSGKRAIFARKICPGQIEIARALRRSRGFQLLEMTPVASAVSTSSPAASEWPVLDIDT